MKSPHPHGGANIPILNGMAKKVFIEKMIFRQRFEGGEGASPAYNWRKRI